MTDVYFLFLELLKNVTFSISNKDTLARSLAEQTRGNKNENKCDICLGIFPSQNILKKHYEKDHGKTYFECNVCFARFNYQRNLYQHLEDSHEKKDLKKILQCTKCPKAFATKVQMEGHICETVTDSNMLTYLNSALKCEKCKITFDNRFDWNEHIMKHSQEKMLNEVAQNSSNSLHCKLCKISFASKATWTEHILSHAKQKVMKHFMEIEKSMPQKPPFDCSKVIY